VDREYLLDRLQSLRTIVPVFAKELASARRQVARLRQENRRLVEQVRQLQRRNLARGKRGGREGTVEITVPLPEESATRVVQITPKAV
jgi:hypothetical protein